MIHVASFSGGKDSTAMLCWLREKGIEFETVFCDTGWEHPDTYAYVEKINQQLLGGTLVTLKNPKLPNGMRDLVQIKKRVPSSQARFCTSHLKVLPMIDFLKTKDDEVTVYVGIRADESRTRAVMTERQWSDDYDAWVERPLLRWTAAQCFDLMQRHGVEPNPLYLKGASRVGCFPCVLVNQGDLKRVAKFEPEIWERVKELETIAKRSFFPPGYIPKRFHSGFDPKSGKTFPTAEDVQKYIEAKPESELSCSSYGCMSVYNLCE